jgi:hypothetical protein
VSQMLEQAMAAYSTGEQTAGLVHA